jgi:hypothetical protein
LTELRLTLSRNIIPTPRCSVNELTSEEGEAGSSPTGFASRLEI